MFVFKADDQSRSVDERFFYIQTSLLFSNENRQRMLRIHNIRVPVTHRLSHVYEKINYKAVVAAMAKIHLQSLCSTKAIQDIKILLLSNFKKLVEDIFSLGSKDLQQETTPFLAIGVLGILKSLVLNEEAIARGSLTRSPGPR